MLKNLKLIKIATYLMFSFMVGFLVAFFIYNQTFLKLIDSFKIIPWWGYFLIVFIMFMLTLALHELTHALIFRIQGVKIKAVYLFIFKFIKKNKVFIPSIDFRLAILGGGLVVPDLNPITNEEEYNKISKIFAKSLIAAPIATIVFMILMIIADFFMILFVSNLFVLGVFTLSTIATVLLSLLYIASSKVSTDQIAGDFVAHDKMLNDELFRLNAISSYLVFNNKSEEESKAFINNKIINYLLKNNQSYNALNQIFLINHLADVVFENEIPNEIIEKRVLNLNMNLLAKTENGVELGYLIVFRKYQLGLIQEAYQDKGVLESISRKSKIPAKKLNYKEKKANHLLNIKNEIDFINNPKNIYQGLNFIYKGLIDFIEIEFQTNINLKPGKQIIEVRYFNKI